MACRPWCKRVSYEMHQHARLANRILPAPLRLELELLDCTLSRNETKRVALLLLLVCLAVLLTKTWAEAADDGLRQPHDHSKASRS